MKARIVVTACFIFSLFALLIAHYFTLQIIQFSKWHLKAAGQHQIVVNEPFRRGAFYGYVGNQPGQQNPYRPLVFDVTKFHLFIDPLSIASVYREDIWNHLSKILPLEVKSKAEFDKRSHSRCLWRWVNSEQKKQILQWWQPYAKKHKIPSNALYMLTDYQRCYPYGCLLGQTLHTIRDLKQEGTALALPTGGLEAFFNEYLKGQPGKRRLLRSPRNHLELDQLVQIPEDGADIYLTIHPVIQAIAEEEITKAVEASGAKGGWAVMMEARTGNILALAQAPAFHPSSYASYFNNPDMIELTKVHAVMDAFELGSIMKPITIAIALKGNQELIAKNKPPLFDPYAKMDVSRSIFPGRASKPLRDLVRCKFENMAMAIQKSSNVYMAQLADRIVQQLGDNWYRQMLIECFGFGTLTHLEMPAEAMGLVPSKERFHPNGAPEWSLPTPYSLSIGYNLLATGMQMVRAYAVFANGGYLVQPTLIRQVIHHHLDGREEILIDHTCPGPFPRVLDPEIAQTVLEATKYTTKVGGTGHLAAVPGYTEAGKTGSAEKIIGGQYAHKTHISSFIGVSPARPDASNPLVLLISIDEPKPILQENGVKGYLGGRCAAPVFCAIMQRALLCLGVPQDDPFGYPTKDPRYDPDKADWVREVNELKRLFGEWNTK
ncbi:MAG: penicillin-binding protein 2 [Verrucomicrobia bacterium]|nr:penicillin-binding protein 2 [Verrucomicrobiota bacterium]MBS0645234.1 penicillin-binding protein 2 [Verrucomicrobiota bacterium]